MRSLTGLGGDARLDLLAPHVTGFRALMALLTHAAVPLPIGRALQVRNRLVLHRPATGDAPVLKAWVAGQRTLEKGLEVDLRTALRDHGGTIWEGETAFYYPGSFLGPGETPSEAARPPPCRGPVLATWRAPSGVGLRTGRLTGDFNPLHYSRRYARRRGFSGPFLHPQLALGQCLARLPGVIPDCRYGSTSGCGDRSTRGPTFAFSPAAMGPSPSRAAPRSAPRSWGAFTGGRSDARRPGAARSLQGRNGNSRQAPSASQ
jgi:hypothetical protein